MVTPKLVLGKRLLTVQSAIAVGVADDGHVAGEEARADEEQDC